jgi:immunoglobulin-binding protein 1
MSIDEFLSIEAERGNIISGGGQASYDRETDGERSQRIREGDDQAAYEEDERKVMEERKWDEYRDTHRKGEGNMMNRG